MVVSLNSRLESYKEEEKRLSSGSGFEGLRNCEACSNEDAITCGCGQRGPVGGCHPGGNPGANLKSIYHRCSLFDAAFVWELTKETIHLPLGCLQGGRQEDVVDDVEM